MKKKLTHLNEHGEARMVDVGAKAETERAAVARGFVRMARGTVRLLAAGGLPKGDALPVARLAGILAAKRTDELIPLCHTLPLSAAEVSFRLHRDGVEITARAATRARTGVEMEALAAVSVAALALYDMAKAVDKDMVIDSIYLVEKTGGRSGPYRRKKAP